MDTCAWERERKRENTPNICVYLRKTSKEIKASGAGPIDVCKPLSIYAGD